MARPTLIIYCALTILRKEAAKIGNPMSQLIKVEALCCKSPPWEEYYYGTSMSEHQALVSDPATSAGAAITSRPRISADAFRNLSARLKKPDTVIPVVTPISPLVVAPNLILKPEAIAVDISPIEASVAPVVAVDAEPVVEAAPIEATLEVSDVRAFPALQLPPGFNPVVPNEAVDVPVVALPAQVVLVSDDNGAFAENFTYVPENGKADGLKLELSGVEAAIKLEIAQRAIELELENIWRLMLAKPTADDRAMYLREADEIHSGDDAWNSLDPEHDLSRIEPAVSHEQVEDLGLDVSQKPTTQVANIEGLPAPEGQDLGELARSLLDMMASGNASGLPHERALAADTLLRLVSRLELKPLIMLAQRLAMMDAPPNLLVARLIRDPRVEVAGPLLEDCVQITDRDLETVVSEGEPAKMRMIARRRNLGHAISEVLIKSGDPSVVLTLVRNAEAEISHEGFQSLLVLAENHEELLAPIATRQDFSAQYAFELFWLAPAQLRRFILSRFLTDSETLTKILKITMATKLDEEGEVEPLNQHVLLEGLERAARGHLDVAAEELSGTIHLSSATVLKVLSDLQGDALVVMLKAAGYPRSALMGLLKRMQDADMPLVARDRDITELQNLFETLSFNKARILLTYWDWAQSKTGPYAPAH
jgi:Uncharacterised protein conserved in bacteria (DUF2336)